VSTPGREQFVCPEYDGCTFERCEYEGEDDCHWLNVPVAVCHCGECQYIRGGQPKAAAPRTRCPNCGGPVTRESLGEGWDTIRCTVTWCGWHTRLKAEA